MTQGLSQRDNGCHDPRPTGNRTARHHDRLLRAAQAEPPRHHLGVPVGQHGPDRPAPAGIFAGPDHLPVPGLGLEYAAADGTKQPFYISAGTDGMFALAGLYEWWADPSKGGKDPARWLLSATTLTKDSAPELAHIHDRNPVLLSPDTYEAWLDPHIEGDAELLEAVSVDSDRVASEAEFFKVGAEVGQVRNNSADLIRPIY